jgi:hypothetical protein
MQSTETVEYVMWRWNNIASEWIKHQDAPKDKQVDLHHRMKGLVLPQTNSMLQYITGHT